MKITNKEDLDFIKSKIHIFYQSSVIPNQFRNYKVLDCILNEKNGTISIALSNERITHAISVPSYVLIGLYNSRIRDRKFNKIL